MSEAAFWREIKKNVGHLGHWTRIESHATADGFPDTVFTVNLTDGFMELKQENNGTPIIRPSQVRWFRRAVRQGSNCWLFSKVNDLYILHKGHKVPHIYDKKLDFWIDHAKVVWIDKVNWEEFISYISKRTYP